MKSSDRRGLILDLISKHVVETQDDLLLLLREMGVETTQATVSRDVKKLNLVKALDSNGKYRYTVANSSASAEADSLPNNTAFIHNAVLSIDYAMNNVVVKCKSGMAQAACATIDMLQHDLILGTIAGDDTVLIITRSTEESKELCQYFNNLIRR